MALGWAGRREDALTSAAAELRRRAAARWWNAAGVIRCGKLARAAGGRRGAGGGWMTGDLRRRAAGEAGSRGGWVWESCGWRMGAKGVLRSWNGGFGVAGCGRLRVWCDGMRMGKEREDGGGDTERRPYWRNLPLYRKNQRGSVGHSSKSKPNTPSLWQKQMGKTLFPHFSNISPRNIKTPHTN